MKKTYLKTLWRAFTKHKARFLSLILIVVVSVGFISGIGSSRDKINYSLSEYYADNEVSDFIVKSKLGDGFTDGDIAKITDIFGEESVFVGASVDMPVGEKRSVRYYFYDGDLNAVNRPELISGSMPTDSAECLAERSDHIVKGVENGSELTLDFKEILTAVAEANGEPLDDNTKSMLTRLSPVTLTVSGTVQSPLTFALDGEPSYNNPEDAAVPDTTNGTNDMDILENIYYISASVIPNYKDIFAFLPDKPVIANGDMYIKIADRELFNAFSEEYNEYIAGKKAEIEEELGADNIRVLTLEENFSFKSLTAYADKVQAIGYILMTAFLAVTVLVALSNMTRLLEEERGQIACLKTLGYSTASVVGKYALFALVATLTGGAGAYFVGLGLTHLIYFVFNYSFSMPPVSAHAAPLFYILTDTIIILGTVGATLIAGIKMANERPASLLRPKPPKAGKKVFLEKITPIWRRLPFKYKSTMRNVLRYKSRFLMTTIAVAVSMALVLAGLALLDMCIFTDFGSPAIIGIAVVILAFAGLLTAVVIYTLTTINVSERNREIATLMVLGYYDREVTGYVYREIYINTLVGIIVGYPLAVLFMWLVFAAIGFGSVGGVSWFMWLLAPVVVFLFTGLVTLILRRKIVKIEMNDSLKAIE